MQTRPQSPLIHNYISFFVDGIGRKTGGFGNYLNLRSAAKIGLLPDIVAERAKVIGNAALGGALMLLCDRSLRAVAEKIAENAFTVELSSDRFFSEAYINGMMFP